MFKLITGTLTLAVCLGTAGLIASNANSTPSAEARLNADGAYRDGLFVGRLAAQSGLPMRPMTGRWSTKQDRSSFAAGYERGYNGVPGPIALQSARQ